MAHRRAKERLAILAQNQATMTSSLLYKSTNTTVPLRRTRPVWPDAVALREVLQHPATALTNDLDLNRAHVALGRDGLPLVYTGRFAAVFRLILPGDIPVALRVFTGPDVSLSQERYLRTELITAALERNAPQVGDLLPPPLLLSQAVCVDGTWYPAQILPWNSGQSLLPFIDAHRHQPEVLRTLAGTVRSAVMRMEAAGIAHGDLQHDNLMVSNQGKVVTLVDYDSLYAPEIAHLLPPAERGHPNYQHPARVQAHYGPGMDRFAAAVMGTGLLLLAHEPALWDQFHGALGEGLLFTATDFAAPKISSLFSIAESHAKADNALADILHILKTFCGLEAPTVLPVVPVLPAPARAPERTIRTTWPSRVSPTCDEETVRPVSYRAPLRSSRIAEKEVANFTALRLYLLIAPPLVVLVQSAAWDAGGAKWPFLACLFAVCAGLLFAALYLAWPVKHQWDGLQLEAARLNEEQRRADLRMVELLKEQEELHTKPMPAPDTHAERAYITDALSRVPISRAIGAIGIAPETVRALRRNGIENAAQLWRRHPVLNFSAGITSVQIALLRSWIQDGEAFHAERFQQETSPLYAIETEIARLDAATQQRSTRLAELSHERSLFPDASLRAYLRAAFQVRSVFKLRP